MMMSVVLGLCLLGQNYGMGYPPIPTAVALTPDDCIAIACKNGVVVTLNAGGIDDFFMVGFNPHSFAFSKSGRYLVVDESPPDDPHRLFIFDRLYHRMLMIVLHELDTYDWHVSGAFLDSETQVYCLISRPWYEDDRKKRYKFADIKKNTIREVTEPEEIEKAEAIFATLQKDESELVAERAENRRWMHIKRKSDGTVLRRLAPTDDLWYQEYTLINDRLLVTHSSRGIEFIDVREGSRLLYMGIHERRSGAVTFFTPDGSYFVQNSGLRADVKPLLPKDMGLDWKESRDGALAALREVLRIAKEGWAK